MPRKYNLGGDYQPLQLPPVPNLTGGGGRGLAAVQIFADAMARRRAQKMEIAKEERQREAYKALTELSQEESMYEDRSFYAFEHDPGLRSLTQPSVDEKGEIVAASRFVNDDGSLKYAEFKDFLIQEKLNNNYTEEDAEAFASGMLSRKVRRVYSEEFGRMAHALGLNAGLTPSQTATFLEGTVALESSVGDDDFRNDVREQYLKPLYDLERRQVGRTEADLGLDDPDERLVIESLTPIMTGQTTVQLTPTNAPSKWGLEGVLGEMAKDPSTWGPNLGPNALPTIRTVPDREAPNGFRIVPTWNPVFNASAVKERQRAFFRELEKSTEAEAVEAFSNLAPGEGQRANETGRRGAAAILSQLPGVTPRGQPAPKTELEIPALRRAPGLLPDGRAPKVLPGGDLGWGYKFSDDTKQIEKLLGPRLKDYDTP